MINAVDLFCGAGGTSTGMLQAGTSLGIDINLLAVNHWDKAIATHSLNHPNVRHLCESLDRIIPSDAVLSGRLGLLAASPECTHHSNAAGGRPRSDQSRATAWHVCRWAADLTVDNIFIENVAEFQNWGPLDGNGKPIKKRRGETFQAFVQALRSMNYRVEYRIQNAADFGDPTSRRRLILLARRGNRGIVWPDHSHGDLTSSPHVAASEIIDWSIPASPISKRKKPLAANTMRRIEEGLRRYGGREFIVAMEHGGRTVPASDPLPTVTCAKGGAFGVAYLLPQQSGGVLRPVTRPVPTISTSGAIGLIVEYYGNGSARPVSEPLPTITCRDRFALVQAMGADVYFRMLQPHELAAAMSFPSGYQFSGTKTDAVKQIGNAVPVRLARAHCAALLDMSRTATPRVEQGAFNI